MTTFGAKSRAVTRTCFLSLLLVLFVACGRSGPDPTAIPTSPPTSSALAGVSTADPASTSVPMPTPTAGISPAESATPPPPEVSPTATPEKEAVQTASEAEWVRDRLAAVATLYDLTAEGQELLGRLDVRQMTAQPGFFGSYGYKSWTGVGEAKPAPVMHELSHAYWGAFPISGVADLSWEREEGTNLSPAMVRYHRDVVRFMGQPPGHYELLRSRLRNIPELSEENLAGLFHSVEGDMVGHVAGDLDLLPPILRKYWDRFLEPGPWHSWYEAASWFRDLSGEERGWVSQYAGFEHLDLRAYDSLPPGQRPELPAEIVKTLRREERQRLLDFAHQFELLLGSPDYRENFDFWRGYLRDMVRLHGKHGGFLDNLDLPNARAVSEALTLLRELEGDRPERKAEAIVSASDEGAFILNFLPVLDNRTLLAYFALEPDPPELATIKGTAAFVERLKRFTPAVDEVLAEADRSVDLGTEALGAFLAAQDFENKRDLNLFIALIRDADGATARRLFAAQSDSMVQRLLMSAPAALRSVLVPGRLLDAVGIAVDSAQGELVRGIDILVTYPSGNFLIDEPFLAHLYKVVAAVADGDPAATLRVIRDSPFPIEGFIRAYPERAVAVLSTGLDEAASIVIDSDAVVFPPQRFVYRLIPEDPALAALLVGRLYDQGERDLGLESLAHFAYDADRLEAVPGLPISLAANGRFLARLLKDRGPQWLEARLDEVVRAYTLRVEQRDAPPDFLAAYGRTLDLSVSKLSEGPDKRALAGVIESVFSP